MENIKCEILVDRVCELQRQIDEYRRYMGDLLIMLSKGEPQCVVEHEGIWNGEWIWDKVRDLLKENKDLARKLEALEEK